jgi:hypothetical protein
MKNMIIFFISFPVGYDRKLPGVEAREKSEQAPVPLLWTDCSHYLDVKVFVIKK